MRNEQIIAAVTRLVIRQVREIRGVETFVASCLHLWAQMPLGMLCYSDLAFDSRSCDPSQVDRLSRGSNPSTGIKRGNLPGLLRWAPATNAGMATCLVGTAAA